MSHQTENAAKPTSQTRATASSEHQWIQLAPTFADWGEHRVEHPDYRTEIELDANAGGVALQIGRNRDADSPWAEISGGWQGQESLEEGTIIRARFETEYLQFNDDGTTLNPEGYFSIAKPMVNVIPKAGELAAVGSSMTLTTVVPETGNYRIRVSSRFYNGDVTTERPTGASRVFITLERSIIVMQAPGRPVAI